MTSTTPYRGYVYAYPHKTAYRPLAGHPAGRPLLSELWASEPKDALSLYLHIPFCEVRCGFCNLFTRIGAPDELTTRYLDALDRQATAVRDALGDADPVRYAAAAFGGGTPTFLTAGELERLCDIAEKRMGADLRSVPLSVETSPSTATADRLAVLADRGTTRVSIGVQSFVDAEARAAVRPQHRSEVEAALGRIRDARVPVLNIDLIYGIDGQTEESWRFSLDAALAWRPEELYLYPLYVRPLTGLGRHRTDADAPDRAWDEQRLRLYRAGRDHLLAHGYEQVSMRMFRLKDAPQAGPDDYACQTDGMIGLGCGARSYTSSLHYSFDYAVEMREIRGIIDDFTATGDFSRAEVGRYVTGDEARRRHLLQSLLQAEGLDRAGYRERFGTDPHADFPAELERFAARGWLDGSAAPGGLRLSPEGLAHSDALGPELFSPAVRAAMSAYEAK
ncbi:MULTISPECIES: STM4012 family radical SAM protein [unclassified Streptomyces]|uniref:STM4012 family radical SAM protein n=1 Tax=unclassified Streptomyces TaxID=2593676 RepID=UPI00081B8A90|nr:MULTISPECIES: STM4012 family radical SAM protein [unclassified Streptomyces]MYQ50323.1 coproporphyrinogen III oxidase family protein [Streptomyces sp. SID4941]SCD38111.1 oxygen-independent coproporphyrinogen-3 oxidase [Streptomyces sp. PalvLS-984]SDD70437.1 oxygen-independent coproporphyrinogen-3 oxidase [Streptomyces sp. AmelKG-A3]